MTIKMQSKRQKSSINYCNPELLISENPTYADKIRIKILKLGFIISKLGRAMNRYLLKRAIEDTIRDSNSGMYRAMRSKR